MASSLLTRLLSQGEKSVGALVSRMDGWVNQLTGLGTTLRDKGMATRFERTIPLTVEECEALFHGDDMANRIVTAVPDDALREGFEARRSVEEDEGLDLPDAELEEEEPQAGGQDPSGAAITRQDDADVGEVQEAQVLLQGRIRELEVVERLREAMTWGRCMGGAAVLLLVDGSGSAEMPLVDERVTRVIGLAVVDRGDLTPATWYQDPSSPKYGDVETWYINLFNPQGVMVVSNVRVHETRLVMFRGAMTSRRERIRNGGWDHSVLQRSINVLRQTNTAWDSVIHMMNDLSQAVFKINGLIDAIAEDDATKIQKRMAVVDMVRSVARAIVLDSEDEDFKVVERGAVTGIDGLVDKLFLRLASTARMPVSILMGQSPAGLQNNGAIDLRWWYDTVRTAQTHEIKPRAERIVRLLARELFPGEDPTQWEVAFPSLWQMTPTEEADLRSKVATTDKAYVDMEAVLPEEVTLSRFRAGDYSKGLGPLVVDLESRKRMLAAELKKAELAASKPTPTPPPQLPPGAPPPGQEPEEDPEGAKPPPPGGNAPPAQEE